MSRNSSSNQRGNPRKPNQPNRAKGAKRAKPAKRGGNQTSGKAIASLILGLTSVIGMCFTSIPGLILGIMGLGDVKRGRGRVGGKGLAIAGIVLNILGLLWAFAALAVALLMPGVFALRNATGRKASLNNMRQQVRAMQLSEKAFGKYPAREDNGLSWRVNILPFIDGDTLYQRFHHDEPWDSPHNVKLLDEMPSIYASPNVDVQPGYTVYQVPYTGPGPTTSGGAMFTDDGPIRIGSITDGTPNTIALLEVDAASAVPWTKPADWKFDSSNPKHDLGESGFIFVTFADGSCHMIPADISPEKFKGLVTRNGGEPVSWP